MYVCVEGGMNTSISPYTGHVLELPCNHGVLYYVIEYAMSIDITIDVAISRINNIRNKLDRPN